MDDGPRLAEARVPRRASYVEEPERLRSAGPADRDDQDLVLASARATLGANVSVGDGSRAD
jgi:hypothetical protein